MTSIEAADTTAAVVVRVEVARAARSVDAHVLRLAVTESARRSTEMLDERIYADATADAEAERLAG